jgi:hypothetical protein
MPHCGNYRATGTWPAGNLSIFNRIHLFSLVVLKIGISRVLNKIWIQNIHSIKKWGLIEYKVSMCGKSKHICLQTIRYRCGPKKNFIGITPCYKDKILN